MEREFRLFQVLSREKGISIKTIQTRMHSSRMRTVRCSGRFIGGVCLGNVFPGGYLPRMGCLTRRGSLLRSRGVCQGGEGVVCAGVVESIYLGVSSATSREKERERGGGKQCGCVTYRQFFWSYRFLHFSQKRPLLFPPETTLGRHLENRC